MEQAIQIENISELKKRVAKTGLDNEFDTEIDRNFANGISKFELKTSRQFDNGRMDYQLDINSDTGKGYFNGFHATLHQQGQEPVKHWFKSEDRINAEEAYNMMRDRKNPRAVHKTLYDKENKIYNAWLQINFDKKTPAGNNEVHRYNDKYGFDPLTKLNDYVFGGNTTQENLSFYKQLSHGNDVKRIIPGNKEYPEVLVWANPARKSLAIADLSGKFLSHDQFRTPEALERTREQRNTTDGERTASTTADENNSKVKKNLRNEPSNTTVPKNKQRVVRDVRANKKGPRL